MCHVIKIRPFISLFGLSIDIFTSDNRSTSSDAKGQILIRLWKLQKKSNKNGIIYKMQIDDHTIMNAITCTYTYINRVLKKTTHAIREEGKRHRLP